MSILTSPPHHPRPPYVSTSPSLLLHPHHVYPNPRCHVCHASHAPLRQHLHHVYPALRSHVLHVYLCLSSLPFVGYVYHVRSSGLYLHKIFRFVISRETNFERTAATRCTRDGHVRGGLACGQAATGDVAVTRGGRCGAAWPAPRPPPGTRGGYWKGRNYASHLKIQHGFKGGSGKGSKPL